MTRELEKRIYELLGVKFFRNKILFGLEKFMKKLNIDMKYRLTKFDVEGLNKARKDAVDNGRAHFFELILGAPVLFIVFAEPISLSIFIICSIYCVMVQRYNIIRIDELLEKLLTNKSTVSINQGDSSEASDIDKTHENSQQLGLGDVQAPSYAYDPKSPLSTSPSVEPSSKRGVSR